MLYRAATNSEMTHGTAYRRISAPIFPSRETNWSFHSCQNTSETLAPLSSGQKNTACGRQLVLRSSATRCIFNYKGQIRLPQRTFCTNPVGMPSVFFGAVTPDLHGAPAETVRRGNFAVCTYSMSAEERITVSTELPICASGIYVSDRPSTVKSVNRYALESRQPTCGR